MKRYVHKTPAGERRVIASFHLRGDVVEIEWHVATGRRWFTLDSIVIDGRELTPKDGRAFYDGLSHAYPGSIETVA